MGCIKSKNQKPQEKDISKVQKPTVKQSIPKSTKIEEVSKLPADHLQVNALKNDFQNKQTVIKFFQNPPKIPITSNVHASAINPSSGIIQASQDGGIVKRDGRLLSSNKSQIPSAIVKDMSTVSIDKKLGSAVAQQSAIQSQLSKIKQRQNKEASKIDQHDVVHNENSRIFVPPLSLHNAAFNIDMKS